MTIGIFDIKEKSGKIYLIGRDENNKRVIIQDENDFAPAHGLFYLKKDSVDILEEFEYILTTSCSPTDKKSLFGDELVKVKFIITNFDRVSEFRNLVEKYKDVIFEGDLWGRTLYCLDKLPISGYTYEGNWKRCYIDIETECLGAISNPNNPTDRILCTTCYDSYSKKYNFFYWGGEKLVDKGDIINYQYDNEEDMLEGIISWMTKEEFDVILGWNVSFDVSYLLKRFELICEKVVEKINKLSPIGYYSYNDKYKQFSIWGLCIFDLLEGYKRIVRNQMASFKLDNVAEEELGEHKIEVEIKKLNQLSKKDLFEYNKHDVLLCVKIDSKVNIFHFFDGLRQFVGCPMDDTKYSRSLIDFMLLKKARSMNVVLPTGSNSSEGKKKFEGAYVDAVQGSYRNVIAFDIAGLYPNIIKTFNLSIECVRNKGTPNTIELPEINIDMSKEGIIPSIVNDLMVLRKKYDIERDKYPAGHELHEKNDILVESAKLIVDAIYGITAFPQFRLFKSEIASTITYMGREIIKHTKDFIEKELHTQVVVTDTDSSYFISTKQTPDEVIQQGRDMLELINIEYPRWVKERWGIKADHCYLKNVFKKVYRNLIVGTKKRYCGRVIWAKGITSNKLEVVGMASKRSDYSRFARNLQKELMEMLLDERDTSDVAKFLTSRIEEMRTTSPSLIAIPTKIEKDLSEYKTNLPKVRGAEYSSKIIGEEFSQGDKPLLLFTRGESDIILFYNDIQANKLLEKVKIDWEKMIERNIILPSEMLLESDGRRDVNSMLELSKNNQKTLFSF